MNRAGHCAESTANRGALYRFSTKQSGDQAAVCAYGHDLTLEDCLTEMNQAASALVAARGAVTAC